MNKPTDVVSFGKQSKNKVSYPGLVSDGIEIMMTALTSLDKERRRDTSNNGGQSNNKNVEKLKRGIFSSSGYFRTSHVCE